MFDMPTNNGKLVSVFLHALCPRFWYCELHKRNSVVIKSFIYPTECTTRVFYKNVKTYIKMFLHVSVTWPSSGSLLLCFAKVI